MSGDKPKTPRSGQIGENAPNKKNFLETGSPNIELDPETGGPRINVRKELIEVRARRREYEKGSEGQDEGRGR